MAIDRTENAVEMKSDWERMAAGEYYGSRDAEIAAAYVKGQEYLDELNTIPNGQREQRIAVLKKSWLKYESGYVLSPVRWWYGHIEFNGTAFINVDCILMDDAKISFGHKVAVGPRCTFITVSHPLELNDRIRVDKDDKITSTRNIAKPIVIEDGAWIAANVTVLPGVTIGARSVIGAGSVVTKSIPPDVFAAGNPCRIIKKLGSAKQLKR
jgi:maltose O-acetyltransferase